MTRPSARLIASVVALLCLVAACTSSKPSDGPSSRSVTARSTTPGPPSTTTTSPTVDPRAQPAVTAYLNFSAAANRAYQRPWGPNGLNPTAAEDFRKFSVDPARSDTLRYVLDLAAQGQAFRGAPPQPHIKIVSIGLAAKPWPTVVVSDCPTPQTWQLINVKTGKLVPTVAPPTPPRAKPPYRVTVKVIYYHGQWAVYDMQPDRDHTCVAE